MADPRLFRLRAEFRKIGRLALLSHLEVARALERTVRRAGLPFAVSQGFSPHMRIGFGAALPVGVGGTCEIVDIFLNDYVAPGKALEALEQASVPDLGVFACKYVEPNAPAASVAYPFSTYEAKLSHMPQRLIVPDAITVVRKKREKVIPVAEYLVDGPFADGNSLTFMLEAKPSGSLRPDVLVRELLAASCLTSAEAAENQSASPEVLSIMRIAQANHR